MLTTFSVSNYRSLQDLVMPLSPLTVITGDNGNMVPALAQQGGYLLARICSLRSELAATGFAAIITRIRMVGRHAALRFARASGQADKARD